MLSLFSWAYWSFVHFLWRRVCSDPLPILIGKLVLRRAWRKLMEVIVRESPRGLARQTPHLPVSRILGWRGGGDAA